MYSYVSLHGTPVHQFQAPRLNQEHPEYIQAKKPVHAVQQTLGAGQMQ
jgi:hypothetical protein